MVNAIDPKGRVDREAYRAVCEALASDWTPEDQEQLIMLLATPFGMRMVKWFLLKERETMLAVAKFDLTSEQGRMAAITQQGKAMGMVEAISTIFDLTEVFENG